VGYDASAETLTIVGKSMPSLRLFAVAGLVCLAVWPAAAQQKDQRILVTNGANNPIQYFYFAACGAGEWGKDRLGAKEVIQPGAKRVFTTKVAGSDCCHDMRARMATGGSFQKLAVDVCREPEWVVR
jgi:hypothetical protein